MPKTALDVTVKDQDGNVVFSKNEEFAVYDLHLPSDKDGWLGLDDWDITAMTHINLGLEPKHTESYTHVVPLAAGTKSVTVEAAYSYLYEDGKSAVIKSVINKVDFAK
jgi:hypothetical protein